MQHVKVQEYFKTGRHVSHMEEYFTCHMLCLGIRICSLPFLFLIWCSVSAYSEVGDIKLQNYTGSLVLFWTLDFDIFDVLVVSSRQKLKENL
jgi:hypothetical protein